MGANPTQSYGFALFLVAFALIAGGLAGGGILPGILGLLILAASVMLFRKAKPREQE